VNSLLAFDIGRELKLKGNTGIKDVREYQSLGAFVSSLLPNVYVIAGIIVFFLIVLGGLAFIKSAGSHDEEGLQKSQKAITAALVGFLIIFLSYWIIQAVQIITGIQIFGSHL